MKSLATLSRHGHKVAVVGDELTTELNSTSPQTSQAVDARIAAEVARMGGQVDAFVLCDHGANEECSCRFPTPRLVIRATQRLQLDPERAITVSNRPAFLDAAAELGCTTILIADDKLQPSHDTRAADAKDLAGAVKLVLAADAESARSER